MKMKFFIPLTIILGAGLMACSSVSTHIISVNTNDAVVGTTQPNAKMDSIIAPYTAQVKSKMGKVIGECKLEMLAQRPNSNLGNWTCDLLLQYGKDSMGLANEPVMSLYNVGGLRAAITVGPITYGTMFQVMPFDNVVSAVKLPISVLDEMLAYLKAKNGEPIGGISIVNGELQLPENVKSKGYIWVVTSDFLVNGGDNMLFLGKYQERKDSNKLIRNVLIDGVQKTRILEIQSEDRIIF